MGGAPGLLLRLRGVGRDLQRPFHQATRVGDLIRAHWAEVVSPVAADVLCDGGDLCIRKLVPEGRHLATPDKDLCDDEWADRQHRVAGKLGPEAAGAETAVADATAALFVDFGALRSLLLGRMARACQSDRHGEEGQPWPGLQTRAR